MDTLTTHLDKIIKDTWTKNISRDYASLHLLKEDSLKNCFYYHLRRKLGRLLKEENLRIYPEYYFDKLGYRADLAIVRVDPDCDETWLKDMVTEVLAVIELKYVGGSSERLVQWAKRDISKMRNYVQAGKLDCQLYFGIIYEEECSSLAGMDKRSTNNWAAGRVTELNAGYINGKMKFEVNSYNGMNEG